MQWFKDLYDDEEYRKVIKQPMSFTKMKQKVMVYLSDIQMMKDDFDLIFQNCFEFNQQKDRVYKDGLKIQKLITKRMEQKWSKLIHKQNMTLEELAHQEWIAN